MAAPMKLKAVLDRCIVRDNIIIRLTKSWCLRRQSTWNRFFKREKENENDESELDVTVRQPGPDDGPSTYSRLESLKRKTSVLTVRGYTPPPDVEGKVSAVAESVVGGPVEVGFALSDRQLKFQILTKLMDELDHQIPNTELSSINSLKDVIEYFSVPVRDQSTYEDLAQLDLPPNLHIQMEPLRFNADSDTFFEGQTAFPGEATVVTSLKYSRKYKGNTGESKNERSMTEFEKNRIK